MQWREISEKGLNAIFPGKDNDNRQILFLVLSHYMLKIYDIGINDDKLLEFSKVISRLVFDHSHIVICQAEEIELLKQEVIALKIRISKLENPFEKENL